MHDEHHRPGQTTLYGQMQQHATTFCAATKGAA